MYGRGNFNNIQLDLNIVTDENGYFSANVQPSPSWWTGTDPAIITLNYGGNVSYSQTIITFSRLSNELFVMDFNYINNVTYTNNFTLYGNFQRFFGSAVFSGVTLTAIIIDPNGISRSVTITTETDGSFSKLLNFTEIFGSSSSHGYYNLSLRYTHSGTNLIADQTVTIFSSKIRTYIEFDDSINNIKTGTNNVITGTLYDAWNEPIANQNVTITIGTYSREVTTNSTGGFTVTDYRPPSAGNHTIDIFMVGFLLME